MKKGKASTVMMTESRNFYIGIIGIPTQSSTVDLV